jgi:hypothetical protein
MAKTRLMEGKNRIYAVYDSAYFHLELTHKPLNACCRVSTTSGDTGAGKSRIMALMLAPPRTRPAGRQQERDRSHRSLGSAFVGKRDSSPPRLPSQLLCSEENKAYERWGRRH